MHCAQFLLVCGSVNNYYILSITYKTIIVIIFVIVSPSVLQFDDILQSIGEFGPRQRVIYILCCAVVIIPSGIQFAGGFFFTGTPEFHCITPGVKCDLNKCCTNCTKYQFTTFTSAVTEVGMFTFPCLHIIIIYVCLYVVFIYNTKGTNTLTEQMLAAQAIM